MCKVMRLFNVFEAPPRARDPRFTSLPEDDFVESFVRLQQSGQTCAMSSIVDYYRGKTILVTGATGFMGKVLVEKLLRACPDVERLYLLVRHKAGQTPTQRINSIVEGKLFDQLRQLQPDFQSKLRPITSDLLEPDLGLSQSDEELLVSKVNIVFHSAAMVKFQEHLKYSLQMNVLATQRLLGLCQKMTSLEAFIHVSTAYAYCNRQFIEEIVYPPRVHPQKLLDCIEWMDDDMVSTITPDLVRDHPNTWMDDDMVSTITPDLVRDHPNTWMDDDMVSTITPDLVRDHPNTYTFSKGIAENLLLEQRGHVPLAIIRPSIVTATWREPLPGWVDNFNGPTGIFIAIGKGILRTMSGDPAAKADIVPVDVPINLMIAAAWNIAVKGHSSLSGLSSRGLEIPINLMIAAAWNIAVKGSGETQIYNCTTGTTNPYTWGQIATKTIDFYLETPLEQPFRIPPKGAQFTLHRWWHEFWVPITHLLPAYISDVLFRAMGKKPRMVRLYDKLHKSLESLDWFTCRGWDWSNTNVMKLQRQLSEEDRKLFYFDVSAIDWDQYMENYLIGAKRYVLKEDVSKIPECRRYIQRVLRIQYVLKFVAVVIAWRVLIARSRRVRNLWFVMIGQLLRLLNALRLGKH
ncbi:FAR1 [Branchiostoma lanceolatum]|uniref:Fatty acyl-CoA reductase n=1 Tax=Branchiostoma lanceolatum TaxID=7740 RepID=A0A8J9ZJD8_BRALA|nr:FAR1 [Branchiostoma lanceolatum]